MESLIVFALAIAVYLLYRTARNQRVNARKTRKRIVDRAWRRDDVTE